MKKNSAKKIILLTHNTVLIALNLINILSELVLKLEAILLWVGTINTNVNIQININKINGYKTLLKP